MSPGTGDLTRRVAAVRRHLRRRSALAAGTWVAVGVAGVWVAAWIFAGASGWRAGSVLPLVLDLGLLGWLGLVGTPLWGALALGAIWCALVFWTV